MQFRRIGATLLAGALAAAVVSASSGAVSAQVGDVGSGPMLGEHVAPVDRPILDPFRDPGQPWLPGNRGLEYDTEPGDEIRASADGIVVFAGSVAGDLHVTVRHTSELRTTMAFVAELRVRTGEVVRQGDLLAIAGDSFHFTARVGARYIDPELLFGRVVRWVRLIPTENATISSAAR